MPGPVTEQKLESDDVVARTVQVKAAPKPPSRLWKPRRVTALMARPVSPPSERTKTGKGSVGRLLNQR